MTAAAAKHQSDSSTQSSQLDADEYLSCSDKVFSGWDQYPDLPDIGNPFCCNSAQLRKTLDEQKASLFSRETELHLIDAGAENDYRAEVRILKDAGAIEDSLCSPVPDLRIISVLRKNSLSPLKISQEILLKILRRHCIAPCFLDLTFSFRNIEELSDKGQSLWAPIKASSRSSEICYQLKYVERNDHRQGAEWSERQIGVYHRFGTQEDAVMILLHAGPNTEAQRRINQAFSNGQYTQTRASSPLLLHCLIISTYLDNWRWCLDHYGRRCLEKENRTFVVSLHHHSLSFAELQDLRNLQSKLLVASTILKATYGTICSLGHAARQLAGQDNPANDDGSREGSEGMYNMLIDDVPLEIQSLETLRIKCAGYLQSIDVLQNRSEKLIKLIADGLSLQSQNATIEIAGSTHKLTEQSVNDNAIVKVITVVTLIYLPTQGVATFFGMNLTSLPQPSNRITFAKDWWLFLASAIPLTLITLGMVVAAWWLERRKAAERDRMRTLNTK